MIKVRLTFVADDAGREELKKVVRLLGQNEDTMVLQQSREYADRGASIYSSVYLDVEVGRQ